MGLLSLPNELTATIFNELDIPSLLRCGQVCKLFHSIISENTHLLYKIELFASQQTDGKPCAMDDVARLQALRSYNQAWNDMKWSTHHQEVEMADGSSWDLSGGIFAQAIRGTAPSISFIQLPCSIKGIQEKRWIVNLQSILRLRDFYYDVSQDLLVCVEITGAMPTQMVTFHLRRLSTGQDHPQATGPLIQYPLSAEQWNTTFIMQICGTHFGAIFHSNVPGRDTLSINVCAVWNWRTGKQEMVVRCAEIRSFSFITEDLILAAMFVSEQEPTLDIISVASCRLGHTRDGGESANSMTPLEFSSIPYVCRLRYPSLRPSVAVKEMLIRSEPTPSATGPAGFAVPFSSAGSVDHVYAVTLRANLDDDREECTVLLTLRSVLLEQALGAKADSKSDAIAWQAWGPRNTRMLVREPSEVWVCYSYGTRFIQRLPFKDGCVARVYDLNKYAARRRGWVKTADDPEHLWTPLAKRAKLVGLCYMFVEEVVTSLAGRVATIELPGAAAEGQERGWEAAMIGEDNIVVVSPDRERYGYAMMQ